MPETPFPDDYNANDLLVILVLIDLCGSCCNTIQITLSTLCDASASLLLILLDYTNFLQGLKNLSVNGAAGIDVVGWATATVAG